MDKQIVRKVAWAPIVNGKILCARTKGLELFYNIGGKPEPGESDIDALVREVKEETTADLIRDSIKFVKLFKGAGVDKAAGKETHLLLYSADHEGTIQPAGEIEEILGLGVSDRHRVPPTGRQIIDWLYSNGVIT